MKSVFNRILVPVVFNAETAENIMSVISLANDLGCDLHLLNVKSTPTFFHRVRKLLQRKPDLRHIQNAEEKMQALVEQFRIKLADGLLLNGTVVMGNYQAGVKRAVITNDIDLVVIPGYHNKLVSFPGGQININKLSQHTQCPVLTVSKFSGFHMQNIVVAINDFLPLRKLIAATFLAKRFDGMVHLLGQRSDTNTIDINNTMHLTKAYQLLRNYTRVKVHRSVSKNGSVAEDILDYARRVHADLIVVNPGKESLLSGLFNRWIEKYLPVKSNIPVLTISSIP